MNHVLFISYFWPPSGKASVHWPLKMAKYLPEFGWSPSVLTSEGDAFSPLDESLITELDPRFKVLRTKSFDPFAIYRRFLGKDSTQPLVASEASSKDRKDLRQRFSIWIRMNLFVPDARIGWYWPAVRHARQALKAGPLDAIVSIGPPHTGHLIGKNLAKRFRVPHVPVFIDPWVDIVYYRDFKRNRLALAWDNAMERSVMNAAQAVVFVTKGMREQYVRKYPALSAKSSVLYWGYDEADFAGEELPPAEKGVIVHAGNLFDYQNPLPLWNAVKRRVENGDPLKMRFVGTVGPQVRQSIDRLGLSDRTEYLGFLPYRGMLQELSKASYLLACVTEERHVPGKLFEYLRIGRPIIAFGQKNEEVRQILLDARAGMMYRYDEAADDFFDRAGEMRRDLTKVRQYDRKNIAKELGGILRSATGS